MSLQDANKRTREERSPKTVEIVLIAALVMLLHDTIGASAARFFKFPISWLYPISLLIWGSAGFFATRGGSLKRAIAAGAILGVTDTTIGWLISSAINGGGPKTVGQTLSTVISMTSLAAGLALAGGGIQKATRR